MNIRGTYTLFLRETLRFKSVWVQTLLGPVISVLLFVAIFAAAFGRADIVVNGTAYLTFIVPGLALMAILQNAFANTSSSILIAKVSGTIVDVLMAPLAPYELLIGYVSAAVLRALLIVLALTVSISPFVEITVSNWGLAVAIALLASIAFALLGIINGIMATRMEHVAGTSTVVIAPLTMLAGTFYSVTALDDPFRSLSLANPVFYMVDAFRSSFTGISEGDPFLTVLGLLVANGGLIWMAVLMLRRGYRLKA